MNTNEILELVRAGYTKEEITAMQPDPAPQPDSAPQPEPEPQPEPKPTPQPESIADIFNAELKKTLDKMNETLEAIHTANIRHSEGQPPEKPVDIAAKIMAEVIAPQKGTKTK